MRQLLWAKGNSTYQYIQIISLLLKFHHPKTCRAYLPVSFYNPISREQVGHGILVEQNLESKLAGGI